MSKSIVLIVLLSVTFECNGHLSILGDILGGAHKHVQDRVHDVAGTILGGLNLNFEGHVDVGNQRYPNRHHQTGQPVIVVVKEQNGYHDRPNQNGQGSYNNQRPDYNQEGQWNGNYNNGHSQNPYGNNQNQGHNNNGYSNNNQGHNNYDNPENYPNQNNYNQPQYPNQEQNNQQRPDQNNEENQNNYGNGGNNAEHSQQGNQNNYKPDYGNTEKPEEPRPTFGSIHNNPTENPKKPDKSDKTDGPLFVPLNPNEYVYEGDKITINAPKREADADKKPAANDDNYDIDIRFQDP